MATGGTRLEKKESASFVYYIQSSSWRTIYCNTLVNCRRRRINLFIRIDLNDLEMSVNLISTSICKCAYEIRLPYTLHILIITFSTRAHFFLKLTFALIASILAFPSSPCKDHLQTRVTLGLLQHRWRIRVWWQPHSSFPHLTLTKYPFCSKTSTNRMVKHSKGRKTVSPLSRLVISVNCSLDGRDRNWFCFD